MRRRDVLLDNDRSAVDAAMPRSAGAGPRRGLLVVAVAVVTLGAAACGEDGNDAPGGSAPPASTATTESPAGPGPGSPDTGPSPEAADEAHPSVPVATEADD